MKKIVKKESIKYFLLIIIALSFLLMAPYIRESTTGPDHELYSGLVDQIKENDFQTRFWLMPFIASFLPFTASMSLKAMSALLFMGIILLTYLMGKNMANEWTGMGASALIAFNPMLMREAIQGLLDIPVTFLFCLTIYLYLLAAKSNSWKTGSLFFISSILTVLTKNTGVFIIFVIVAISAFHALVGNKFRHLLWALPVIVFGIFWNFSTIVHVSLTFTMEKSGLLIYLSWLGWAKAAAAIVLFLIMLYLLITAFISKQWKLGIPSLLTFSYLSGFFLVPSAVVVGRHLMPVYPGIMLAFVLMTEKFTGEMKIPLKLTIAGYSALIIISAFASVQHMSRFAGA